MSKSSYAETDDRRGQPDNVREAPTGEFNDDSYASRQSNESVPVVGDQTFVGDPISIEEVDSDQQLARDEREAIDRNKIMQDRLRGDKPNKGALRELGGQETGLAEDE